MLKVALVLGLAVAALATTGIDSGANHQVVRLGSVGTTYSYLNGVLVPYTKHAVDGVPAYELRYFVKGAPQMEESHYNFRCHHIDDSLLPADAIDTPVYLCRNLHFQKGSDMTDEKMTFMFHAKELKKTPIMKEIDLWIGKALTHDLITGVHTRVLDHNAENVIRFGSIGSSFAHFNGFLTPYTDSVAEGVPAFEFRTSVNGVAKKEEHLFNFRCGSLENFYVPFESESKPVFMCRHISPSPMIPSQKKVFLFSAENLNIHPGVKALDLWLGKSIWENFVTDVFTTRATLNDEVSDHIVRVGSIGTRFVGFKGIVVPYSKVVTEGIPSYELRGVVKGVPVEERDVFGFRCHHLENLHVPIDADSRPIYLCRDLTGLRTVVPADKNSFLFSAEHFDIPATTKTFDLWIGRDMWYDFISDVYTETVGTPEKITPYGVTA